MEVRFYFQAIVGGNKEAFALCSLYSLPDEHDREYTNGALNVHSCKGEGSLVVIRAKTILSVVGMMPFQETGEFYLVERFSLGVIDAVDDTNYMDV